MKITLSLEEALGYIRSHEDFEFLTEAEFEIIGSSEVATPVEPVKEEPAVEPTEEPVKRRRRRKKTDDTPVVNQDALDEIVAEVETEVDSVQALHADTKKAKTTTAEPEEPSVQPVEPTQNVTESFEEREMSLIDEVLAETAEEDEALFNAPPLVEQDIQDDDILDTSAPLFG